MDEDSNLIIYCDAVVEIYLRFDIFKISLILLVPFVSNDDSEKSSQTGLKNIKSNLNHIINISLLPLKI